MESGWYWVNSNGNLVPARYDGNKFHLHGHEHIEMEEDEVSVVSTMSDPQCQTGCICTKNADGSWTIVCP